MNDEMNEKINRKIQAKWREGYVVGHDCIAFGDGRVVIASTGSMYDPNNGETEHFWVPLCDTTLTGMQKYQEDLWTEVDIWHGPFEFENQKIVFGDGGMGNEGYVASVGADNTLNWSMFFTFSNPINKAEMVDRQLICYGDTGMVITIDIDELTKVKVKFDDPFK